MKFSRDAAIPRIPAPHLQKQGQLQLAGASFRDILEVGPSWIALPLRGSPRCQEGTNGEESMLKRMLLPFVQI